MPAPLTSTATNKEVAPWRLYAGEFGARDLRALARRIDHTAGNANGKISVAEVDAFIATRPSGRPEDAVAQVDAAMLRSGVQAAANASLASVLGAYSLMPAQAVGLGLLTLIMVVDTALSRGR